MQAVRPAPLGDEPLQAMLPAAVTMSNERGGPRQPGSRLMMAARRTPLPGWRNFSVAGVQGRRGMIDGATLAGKARGLHAAAATG